VVQAAAVAEVVDPQVEYLDHPDLRDHLDLPVPAEYLRNSQTFHSHLQQVRDHVVTYINTQSREAQDSIMLYTWLTKSLSQTGRTKVNAWASDYYVGELPGGQIGRAHV